VEVAQPMTSGVLVIDKPKGPTSFEVVRRVKQLLRAQKAGHTGTLDPMATGVLAVCLGEAVKLQQFLTEGDKAYQAEVAFGVATDTEDAEGAATERGDPSGLSAGRVASALSGFLGEIDQVPPLYSAVRVGGRRLHRAARAGEDVERAPRRVRIHALELLSFEPASAGLARARLAVRCGKGTYVRTLAADLGRALGVPAHLAALRRTAAGPFSLAGALPLAEAEALARRDPAALRHRLLPLEEAVGFLPAVRLGVEEARALLQGRPVSLSPPAGLSRALSPEGRLLAICAGDAAGLSLLPVRVFPPPRPGARPGLD
jgi:tRNA pseudouridine55 synthase